MGPETWTAIGGLAVGAGGIGAAIRAHRTLRGDRREASRRRRSQRRNTEPTVGIVVNPTKVDMATFRPLAEAAAREYGYEPPTWWLTAPDSPGTDQAASAVDSGASLVVAAGGDGTVRAVAGALVGTRIPLGIVPTGTGNLLARNLALPLFGLSPMLRVAFDGRDRAVDVGRISAAGPGGPVVEDEVFLVITGLGFDAAMVSDTKAHLKRRVGWPAYFMSGVQNLKGPRIKAAIDIDGAVRSVRARSIMIGNCGRLPAGVRLLPNARIDDGLLDIAMVDARAGIVGWASLAAQIGLQGIGVRNLPRFAIGRLLHEQARRVRVVADGDPLLQIDGEAIGQVTELSARVIPKGLLIKVR
ncbi:MAG: hypothetical protein LBH48_03215 [Bifidobacteriaceae bacterium]|nr:hypothetical protein [Bifidobacteriaceae bacterium]